MAEGEDDDLTLEPGYVPPRNITLDQILKFDMADDSLKKYKEALLNIPGSTSSPQSEVFPNDPRRVIVQKLALVVQGRPEIIIDLTGDLSQLKKTPLVLKEGVEYRVKIYFYVQREIVSGLRYVQKTYRKGIPVDKSSSMIGSYGPGKDLKSFITIAEEAPSGMMARGTYTIKSLFTDDDKHEHLKWEWLLEIKKDWE